MPPLSAHVPIAGGWSRPDRRLRTAGPAKSKRPASLRHRTIGILSADQAKHRERIRHGLDTGRTHPKMPKRPCLRQILDHQPKVGLGSNSHNHSLATRASPSQPRRAGGMARDTGSDINAHLADTQNIQFGTQFRQLV
jgi:hypothetical protein